MMEFRKLLTASAVFILALMVVAGTVTYLSNTVTSTVTTQSPTVLNVTALDALGNPVDITAIPAYGGETITLNISVENKSNVSQTGKYTLVASPTITTTDVSIDGSNVTTGDVSTTDLATTTIAGNTTENKVVTITFDPAITPASYSLAVTYNVN